MPPRAAHYPEQQAHSRIPMSVPDWRQPQGLRGRPGFKPTCRAEFAAWTASGRAGLGSGGRRQGLAGLRDDAPSERSATKRRRCGGHRGACGACRGAGGRRQDQGWIRDDAPSHTSATMHHWFGGRRRVRRARAGFEIDHSERSSRVAISRAAGPDGARKTPWCHKPRPKVRTPRSTPGSGRLGGRRGDRAR